MLPDNQFRSIYLHFAEDIFDTVGKTHDAIVAKYPDWENFIMNGGIFRLDKILSARTTKHQYFTTFTLKNIEDKEKLKHLVTQIYPHRPTLQISEFHYVEEHIDSNYHIHTLYRSKKSIPKTRLDYYTRYGFIDHQKCKSWNDAYTYINKENNSLQC